MTPSLDFFHRPGAIAVVGASDDPEKIGGRPLRYMRDYGYRGRVLPVNPRREQVQGMATYASLDALPEVPDVALIAVPGRAAVDAVADAARLGVKGCVVMSSGFGEVGTVDGSQLQAEMLRHARSAGMRIVGPNSQGLAAFHSGTILSFSTLFTEDPPADGPVAIVSQSGALASVPYGILRRRGIGVRYAHGTGNDADVTAAELASAVAEDPDMRLLLVYLENVGDPAWLVQLAETARANDLPVVALVGGRSSSGSRAAASHTGALATERRVLDAFFERLGIWQVSSVPEMLMATDVYLQGWTPGSDGLAVVSNSGAVCVLAADAAEDVGIPLVELSEDTVDGLAKELPTFASTSNPIDVTAALLTDSSIFGRVLPILRADPAVGVCLLAIPVAGAGYDVEQFADDAAALAGSGLPILLAVPQPSVARPFRERGLVVFDDETAAVTALSQYLGHRRLMQRAATLPRPALPRPALPRPDRSGPTATAGSHALNESDSLVQLAGLGIPVVAHELVGTPEAVADAFGRLGARRVVVKGCTSATTHKSEIGLVRLGCSGAEQAVAAAHEIAQAAAASDVALDGYLVAPMIGGVREVLIGGHRDAMFGPVLVLGAGGVHVEAVPDTQLLLAPCTADEARSAIARLRMAPLLSAVRGEPAVDVESWISAVVAASRSMADPDSGVDGFDANPVMLLPVGSGAIAVDAVVLSRSVSDAV